MHWDRRERRNYEDNTPSKLMRQAFDQAYQIMALRKKTKARFFITIMAKKAIILEPASNPENIQTTSNIFKKLCVND